LSYLADTQTDKLTKYGKNITSLAEVNIKVCYSKVVDIILNTDQQAMLTSLVTVNFS